MNNNNRCSRCSDKLSPSGEYYTLDGKCLGSFYMYQGVKIPSFDFQLSRKEEDPLQEIKDRLKSIEETLEFIKKRLL